MLGHFQAIQQRIASLSAAAQGRLQGQSISQSSETTSNSDLSSQSATSSTSSSSSSTSHPNIVDHVFGPSHPLHALVSEHLPDVLTRIVLAYQSPPIPHQHHYRGHVVMPQGCYAFRDQRQANMAANPLSLARRSFSWSGWMKCNSNSRQRNHFLLSFESHDQPQWSSWLHIGYRHHNNRHGPPELNRAFTFAFYNNDLDASPAHTDLQPAGCWEHWSGSFDYPPPPASPSTPNTNESNAWHTARNRYAANRFGRRKLYRNGVLVVEDDCVALMADVCSTLVLGNYNHGVSGMTLDDGVCDVRLYSRVLTEAEMRALYEGEEHEVGDEGLEAHWPLQEHKHLLAPSTDGASRGILDVSGNERHLQLTRGNAHWSYETFK